MTMNGAKVELHLHLFGAVKHDTAYELLKKKNLVLPGDGSYDAFVNSVALKQPTTLSIFLKGFDIFMPAISGDLDAIERISYEFCQYQSDEGVIYAEARYTPQLLMSNAEAVVPTTADGIRARQDTLKTIVEAVNRGLERGEKDFGVVVRSVLTCVGDQPDWNQEILNLAVQYREMGVVGIDIVPGLHPSDDPTEEAPTFRPENKAVFEKAAQLGIHRTVHAGEVGPGYEISQALNDLKAERIGHGYHVLDNEKIYSECLVKAVHFECCPQSSLLTSAVSLDDDGRNAHPIVRFAKDGASFSISSDNPTITNTKMRDEYLLVSKWGLTTDQIQQANINAMKNAFAEPFVKESLLKKLYSAYGINPEK